MHRLFYVASSIESCQADPLIPTLSLMQDTLLRIVEVAVQHPVFCDDQTVFCRLLQVCKAWRAVVQQAGPCLALRFNVNSGAADRTCWRSCAAWVKKHAGQVRSVTVSGRSEQLLKPSPAYTQVSFIPPDLVSIITGGAGNQAAVQAAAGSNPLHRSETVWPSSADTSGPACAEPTDQITPVAAKTARTRSPLVHLQRFSSDVIISPALLSSLQATSLTQLLLNDLVASSPTAGYQSALAAPLGKLTGLRHLSIESSYALPSSYLTAVCKLSQLSRLELQGVHYNSSLARMPQQLRQLTLRFQPAVNPHNRPECLLEFMNLTNLVDLELFVPVGIVPGSCLPAQLQGLTTECWKTPSVISTLGLTGLSKLKRLSISGSKERPEQLQSLSSLPLLQELSLDYVTGAAMPALAQLQSLRHLSIGLMPSSAAQQGLRLLTTLKQLTHLSGFDRGGSEAVASF